MWAVEQEYSPCLQQGQERARSSVWTNPTSSTGPWISCGKDSLWYSVLIQLLWLSGANLSVCLYVNLTNILSSNNWMFLSLVNSSLNHIQKSTSFNGYNKDRDDSWTYLLNAYSTGRGCGALQFSAQWLIKWQFRGNSFLCKCQLAGWILSNQFITLSV